MKRRIVLIIMFLLLVLILAGCMPGDGSYTSNEPANIFSGIWHGWIAPISLISGFFNSSIRLYEVNNTGWSYDLGFYLAILGGFGGIAFSRKKDK
jgi:hypothetical protein